VNKHWKCANSVDKYMERAKAQIMKKAVRRRHNNNRGKFDKVFRTGFRFDK
jgi:hypothetical protein